MNAQRKKQLDHLLTLAGEIENVLEDMWEEVDYSISNLEDNDMEHLPVFRSLDVDRDSIQDAQKSVADLWQTLYAAMHA